METINQLQELNYGYLLFGFVVILTAWKFIASLWESTIGKLLKKLDIETKKMREKREEHELLIQTAKNLAELQNKHQEDVEQSIAHDERIRNDLAVFMTEMRDSISKTQSEIKKFAENRVHDRQQSFLIQKELTDAQKELTDSQKELSCSLKDIRDMVLDRNIDEMRWEINNFATKVSEGKPCNKDSFTHCIHVYEKYEKILEENNLENGEVEISMQVINEAYKQKLKEGF